MFGWYSLMSSMISLFVDKKWAVIKVDRVLIEIYGVEKCSQLKTLVAEFPRKQFFKTGLLLLLTACYTRLIRVGLQPQTRGGVVVDVALLVLLRMLKIVKSFAINPADVSETQNCMADHKRNHCIWISSVLNSQTAHDYTNCVRNSYLVVNSV